VQLGDESGPSPIGTSLQSLRVAKVEEEQRVRPFLLVEDRPDNTPAVSAFSSSILACTCVSIDSEEMGCVHESIVRAGAARRKWHD